MPGEERVIPDYENYDFSRVWAGRGIENTVEQKLASRWAKGETGIELGGGYGRITQALEGKVNKMFMLDYSLSNLKRASSKLVKTTLVRGTLERLPFDDDVFDVVVVVRVIHHLPDPRPLLAEVVRVSRNGATFVLGIANETTMGGASNGPGYKVTDVGHRVYPTPLKKFAYPGLERVEVLGVGAFDNAVGRKVERLAPLASLDIKTSRLWPAKSMLFVRYKVRKPDGKREPYVRCSICGGRIVGRRCEKCGHVYGEIIDLVQE